MLRSQPGAFYMIFMLEIWERFGFYTIQGILVLYFIRFLGLTETTAYYTFGAFSALVYCMVAIGGYLGDRILGTKRTIVLGLLVLAAGYLALAFADTNTVFFALGLICVGNGLFKANPSNLLAKSYEKNDSRLHSGFTLYYMAINLGAIFALVIGPELARRYGYSSACFMSCIGIGLGLLNYRLQRKHISGINTPADHHVIQIGHWGILGLSILGVAYGLSYLLQHVMLARNLLWVIIGLVIGLYVVNMRHRSWAERMRMLVALILMIEAIVFFTLYQQMPMSLNLFAVNNVRTQFFSIQIDPQSFQALNSIWIIILSPLIAALYLYFNKRGTVVSVPYKFAMGMTSCGVGFLLLYGCNYVHDANGFVSPGWLVGAYMFQSLGEVLVSALGLAMVAELVPEAMAGFVMGMWFLTSSVAGFTGAWVASYTALPQSGLPGIESLLIYTTTFAKIGIFTLLVALILWCSASGLNRLMRQN